MLRCHVISQVICAALIVCSIGCESKPITACDFYIHNSRDQPVRVTVDGKDAGTVDAGAVKRKRLRFGDRRIQVWCNDQVVYDDTHTLELKENAKHSPSYMFDPSGANHYCRISIVYGDDTLAKGLTGGITSVMTHYASQEVAGDDEKERKRWIEKQKKNTAFHNVLDSISSFGGKTLSEFTGAGYVLEAPPKVILGDNNHFHESRSTVIQIPAEYHAAISKLKSIEDPTDDDIEMAQALKAQVHSMIP